MSNLNSDLARLNVGLGLYAKASGKSMDEVLEKKGRDLGIKLYQGFRAVRWGGNAGTQGNILAFAELRARTAAGRGTRVRASILAQMDASRQTLAQARVGLLRARALGPLTVAQRRELRTNVRRRANLWRAAVGAEVRARGRGVGVLAVSFLWFRKRQSRERGTFFVRNRTGRPLGYVEKQPNSLRIVGLTPGLDVVGERYGVVSAAVNAVTADMIPYISRKLDAAARASFAAAGLKVAA